MLVTNYYSLADTDIQGGSAKVARVLHGSFVEHESAFLGRYFLYRISATEQVRVVERLEDAGYSNRADKKCFVALSSTSDRIEELHRLIESVPRIALLFQRYLDSDGKIRVRQWNGHEFVQSHTGKLPP